MRYFNLIIFSLLSCSTEQSQKSISTLSSFKDSTSYSLGADIGENLKKQNVEIDYDVFMAGLADGMETGLIKLDQKERREVMIAFQKKMKEKAGLEGKNNLILADEFLKKNIIDPDVKETPTGLQYRIIKEGDGASPKKDDRVRVHYVGRLIDGTEFDSSIKRGEPSEFGLTQVIKGWTEGLQLMNLGAKYEFFIHPKDAYGPRPRPTIPANSLLIFEVELLDIISK
tara:strand:- start:407 stop:1087 length:681 start_codon:yes stop_codon:yes gene_type:complete